MGNVFREGGIINMEQKNENRLITDGNYDKSLSVKCNNGTFVGKKTDELIIWKGIPYRNPAGGKASLEEGASCRRR